MIENTPFSQEPEYKGNNQTQLPDISVWVISQTVEEGDNGLGLAQALMLRLQARNIFS